MRRRRRPLAALIAVVCLAAVLSAPIAGLIGMGLLAGGTLQSGSINPAASFAVPERAAVAYQRSAGQCPGLDWILLAAIGAVETSHGQANGATLDPHSGEAHPWIFGPPLSGTNGTAAIPIGPRVGWWGLTGPWTQAVGPMQFLPATFETHAVDADADGVANPHDVDDAVATAAAYVCSASGGIK